MEVSFTSHNMRLDDGSLTNPSAGVTMDSHHVFLAAKRLLDATCPAERRNLRLVDLGCLEGGYSVEFARLGFNVLGIEVRENNIAACRHVKANTDLPNLEFVQDDVWNVAKYGSFDIAFCCGLLYHLEEPRRFLKLLSSVTNKLLYLQTHFATGGNHFQSRLPRLFRKAAAPLFKMVGDTGVRRFGLSPLTYNEARQGRWFTEFSNAAAFRDREKARWHSWDNKRSFWVRREYLLQAIQDSGFDLVMEQYDDLGDIAASMTQGDYKTQDRGTFIGIKTAAGASSS